MKKAVIYARYSCEKQTEQSIEGQLRCCNDYAKKNNIIIVDHYIDRATSGTSTYNRNAFQKMIKDSNKKLWDYVLVYKLDRFARNKYESAINRHTLKENGIKLLSAMENIPDTPEGIILESMLEGMNEYFSAELAQKVRRGLKESREKGQFTGGKVPLGYISKDKHLIIDEDRAQIVRDVFNKYEEGMRPVDIQKELEEKGILFHGKPLGDKNLYYMLCNEKYTGILRKNGEVYTKVYPQIISVEQFERVAKLRQIYNGGAGRAKNGSPEIYLLHGKIYCGKCGKIMVAESGHARNKTVCRYYTCSGHKYHTNKCPTKLIKKEIIEETIINVIAQVLHGTKTIERIADSIMDVKKQDAEQQSYANIISQEIDETQSALDNILHALEQGVFSVSAQERLQVLEQKLDNLKGQLAVEKMKDTEELKREDIIKYIIKAIKSKPRLMIELLIDKIMYNDNSIEIHFNYCDKNNPDDSRDFCYALKPFTYKTNKDKMEFEISCYF